MSRIAKQPVDLIDGVKINIDGNTLAVEGKQGNLSLDLHGLVAIKQEGNQLIIFPNKEDKASWSMAGTMRSLVNNMIFGAAEGFKKELKLVGVGYRATVSGKILNLSLGFSHPIEFDIPEGVKIDAPSQTELMISGADKQLVGEVSAKIRSFRPPEPYKGKGVRYADEQIRLKEAKKK